MINRSQVQHWAIPLLRNDSGQVVHTHVSLSPSSIICYSSNSGDAPCHTLQTTKTSHMYELHDRPVRQEYRVSPTSSFQECLQDHTLLCSRRFSVKQNYISSTYKSTHNKQLAIRLSQTYCKTFLLLLCKSCSKNLRLLTVTFPGFCYTFMQSLVPLGCMV